MYCIVFIHFYSASHCVNLSDMMSALHGLAYVTGLTRFAYSSDEVTEGWSSSRGLSIRHVMPLLTNFTPPLKYVTLF